MSKTIYAILAPSRSGKDSLALELYQMLPYNSVRMFKWADHVKRTVEQTYGLRPFALELDEYRNATIPGTITTYLQLLVDLYHNQDRLSDPIFWKRPSLRLIKEMAEQHLTIISTDTRDICEADAIADLVQNYSYTLVLVRLYRDGHSGLTSDLLLDRNFETLSKVAHKTTTFSVPSVDDYKRHLVPIARSLVELA